MDISCNWCNWDTYITSLPVKENSFEARSQIYSYTFEVSKVAQCLTERLNVKRYATPVSTKLLMCEVCIVMLFHTEMNDYVLVSTSLRLRFFVGFLTLTTVCISIEYIFCHTMKNEAYKWRLRPKGWLKVRTENIVITSASFSNRLLACNMHSKPKRVIFHTYWKFRHRGEMQWHFSIHFRILGLKRFLQQTYDTKKKTNRKLPVSVYSSS